MRFSAFTLFALPLAVLASPAPLVEDVTLADEFNDLEVRTAANVSSSLATVKMDITNLNTTLNRFANTAAPTAVQLININNQATKLEKDLNATFLAVNGSTPFTVNQSTQIYSYLQSQLLPATRSLLVNFINHYPGFSKSGKGIIKAIHDSLVRERATVQNLGVAFVTKANGAAKTNGPALTAQFIRAFNTTITKYSS